MDSLKAPFLSRVSQFCVRVDNIHGHLFGVMPCEFSIFRGANSV
jgi:hypothetical protein